ncbi:MAG: hypothetical protein M5U09_08670 [Gammaproteobacteria bacterium]|nr:hypothetical protein [Gammaproteobacteria bacterium]
MQLLRKFLALEADDRRFFARAWLALARHRWRILRAAPSRLAADVGRAMAAPPARRAPTTLHARGAGCCCSGVPGAITWSP